MESMGQVLLEVWREVCRHLDIAESAGRIAAILGRQAPVGAVLIRQISQEHSCVDTLATGSDRRGPACLPVRTLISPEALDHLLRWWRQGEVSRGPAAALSARLPGLILADMREDVLAGPLLPQEGLPGALLLVSAAGEVFADRDEKLFQALLEPFSVALENDRRLRELTALREAVEADNRSLLSRLGRQDISDSIVGAETGLRSVMEQINLVACSDTPVLVLGETGTGKEVVARAIHKQSRRSTGPFLRVNCGAIPPELVDSELFGHERGSFTGAVGQRKGWFERADSGTLFLDECGELPLAAQVRLLRILQDGSFERVGGERSLHVDVRIVAATHRDLPSLVAGGCFREDLWYRIAVFPIHLPPLRERREDISSLAAHFSRRAAARLGMAPLAPSADDLRLLAAYPWPGNVRELAAVMERAAILGGGKGLEVAWALGSYPASPASRSAQEALPRSKAEDAAEIMALDAAMAHHIESALRRTGGRIEGPSGAAELLTINPHTLRGRMRKLGVDWRRFRRSAEQRPGKNGLS